MNEVHPVNEEAWEEWKEWREKEKKIKIGPVAEKKQRKMLAQHPPCIQQEIIDHSIMNSYQGLFPPKVKPLSERSTRSTSLVHDLNDRSWAQ